MLGTQYSKYSSGNPARLPSGSWPMPTRVLIVDDSQSVRDAVCNVLKTQLGVEVCGMAGNGLEAIAKAKDLHPDVIVLDLKMPGLNGLEVASALRRELPNAKSVVFTLFAEAISLCGSATLRSAFGIYIRALALVCGVVLYPTAFCDRVWLCPSPS